MSGVRKIAASERFKEFSGRVRRWEKKCVRGCARSGRLALDATPSLAPPLTAGAQVGEAGGCHRICAVQVGLRGCVGAAGPSRRRCALTLTNPHPGADTRTEEERLAKRRKYTPLKVDPIPDLESFMPPSGSGWGGEKVTAVVTEPEAPRRSLRARTERTYVDGEDEDDFDERSMSEDEPAAPLVAAAAAPPAVAAPAAAAPPPAPAPAAPAAPPQQAAGPA